MFFVRLTVCYFATCDTYVFPCIGHALRKPLSSLSVSPTFFPVWGKRPVTLTVSYFATCDTYVFPRMGHALRKALSLNPLICQVLGILLWPLGTSRYSFATSFR